MLTNVAKNSISVWNLGSNSCFPKIITISTDLAISSSMSSFVPKLWLKWQILVAIFYEFVNKDGITKVYIPVHPGLVRCQPVVVEEVQKAEILAQ